MIYKILSGKETREGFVEFENDDMFLVDLKKQVALLKELSDVKDLKLKIKDHTPILRIVNKQREHWWVLLHFTYKGTFYIIKYFKIDKDYEEDED